jgi:hypothetical protein
VRLQRQRQRQLPALTDEQRHKPVRLLPRCHRARKIIIINMILRLG